MRRLTAPLAGIDLRHGSLAHRAELGRPLEADDGRIWDHEPVEAVMRIVGDGTGGRRGKVPGLLDWSTMTRTRSSR